MINTDLFVEHIELLCSTGISSEAVQKLIQEENLFDGSLDTLIAENYLKKIAIWKNEYHYQGKKITLYGIINWYFKITFSKIYVSEQDFVHIDSFLLKLWLMNWHIEPENICFKSTEDWNFSDRLKTYELDALEFKQCVRLSADDFIKDLEKYYQISLTRFEYYKTRRGSNFKLIEELTPQYPQFIEYLSYCKKHLRNTDIIRINKLGSDNDEFSWYFIIEAEKVYNVLLSDFA